MYAKLDETLITGNKMIDGQHEELIRRINELLRSCENESETGRKLQAIKTLNFLADYTEYHFAAEEKLQESVGYPELEEHRKKHEELRRTVRELDEMLTDQEGPTEAFVEQVQKNVVDWLYLHIRGYDRSVADYLFMKENTERI